MAALAARVLPPPLLEGDDLGSARLIDDFARHRGAGDGRAADLDILAAEQQHLAELDDLAALALHLADRDDVLGGDPVLLPAGLDDCEHLDRPRVRPDARTKRPDRLFPVDLCCGYRRLAP